MSSPVTSPAVALRTLLLTCATLFLSIAGYPGLCGAQSGEIVEPVQPIQPVITGLREVEVGKTIVLDGSLSSADPLTVSYIWMRDGEVISSSPEALLTLEKAGRYEIRLIVRDHLGGDLRRAELTQEVDAYVRKLVLVAGPGIPAEKLQTHEESAREAGVFLDILHAQQLAIPLGLEDAFTKLIAENIDRFLGAEGIILWSEDGAGIMNALSRALQQDPRRQSLLQTKTVVIITDGSLPALARVVRGPFAVLRPSRIILTRKEAINPLIEVENLDQFTMEIGKRDIDSQIVDQTSVAVRPWNLLSSLVNYMVMHGVSSRMIILLLMLPVILTIIAFLKQVVGITTLGLFAPAVVTLSFIALGWSIGIVLLFTIVMVGYVTRSLINRYRLLYIPKIAIILTVISIVLLLVLAVASAFGILLAPDTIFILLIMATLSEEFMSVKAEQGLRSAILIVLETALVSLICYAIVQWEFLKSLVLSYPEIIILTVIANVFLGKWTGLRITELIRFREIFKYLEE